MTNGKLENAVAYKLRVHSTFVDQIADQDQRTKFMVGEGQIATYNPSQDLNNQKSI